VSWLGIEVLRRWPGRLSSGVLQEMKITPRVGAANARFGMTVHEGIEAMGVPDRDYIDDDGDRCLCYDRLGLVLRFEEVHCGRLGWIMVLNPEATIRGRRAIGIRFSEIESFLDAEFVEAKDYQDFGYWCSTTWVASWLEVQYALGWVQQINLGVCFDDADEPLWPEETTAEQIAAADRH